MDKIEKEALEAKGIKVTICPPRNAKGSGGQKFHLINYDTSIAKLSTYVKFISICKSLIYWQLQTNDLAL